MSKSTRKFPSIFGCSASRLWRDDVTHHTAAVSGWGSNHLPTDITTTTTTTTTIAAAEQAPFIFEKYIVGCQD
jgi:hypothetical protein